MIVYPSAAAFPIERLSSLHTVVLFVEKTGGITRPRNSSNSSPVAGQAILDVYNIAGQKIQTVFNGHIEANETRMIDYKPTVANGMLIYTLRIGNRQVTGKLIGLKQ